ncbi:unnamed protein product [Mytilus edulis]|uniref:CCHC-type domain-containing protein n=1 Tax=Mytilus edulis TaxID=6550 RepID=A0A8S3PP49_MYTED|nr:unnamed protein product [Mytilus edulis]
MLRDRLVVGIKSDRIQRRLLAEPNLTFEKALEIATAMETAEKNAQDIQASGTNGTFQKQINKVSKSYTRNNSGNSKQGDCYRCGGNHLAAECRFKDAKCHSCKKKGHIAKKCRSKSDNGKLSENHREFKSRFNHVLISWSRMKLAKVKVKMKFTQFFILEINLMRHIKCKSM